MVTRTTKAALQQPQDRGPIELPRAITVKDLGEMMHISAVDVIKELMKNGVMATVNQVVDFDTAAIVATDLGFEPVEAPVTTAEPTVFTTSRKVVEEGDNL